MAGRLFPEFGEYQYEWGRGSRPRSRKPGTFVFQCPGSRQIGPKPPFPYGRSL